MKIAIFGTGYVGLVTGASLANLGHTVICVDIDTEKIRTLNEGKIPFHEPGLPNLVKKNVDKKRLSFSTDAKTAVEECEAVFNCVGTPGKEDGSANMDYIFKVTETVARYANNYKIIINKSTIPPGTCAKCQEIVEQVNPDALVEVVSNPEFLREGAAVYDFAHPNKIVIGARDRRAFGILRKIYTGRVRTYIPFIETNWETAELIKYANNAFLATKISFINELANISDKVGADVRLISQAMGLDDRINAKFLQPGIGYGGSCFPKDVRALVHTAKLNGYNAQLLESVDKLNEKQKHAFMDKVSEKFGADLTGKTFTVWGGSFKPKTSDIREASSLTLINNLITKGASVRVHDPVAMDEMKKHFENHAQRDKISYHNELKESTKTSSAIFLATEWDDFRNVDFSEHGDAMQSKIVFDGRNIYEPEFVKEEGFEYFGVGRR